MSNKKKFKPANVSNTNQVESFISGGASVKEIKKVGRPIVKNEPTKTFNCNLPESLFKSLKMDSVEQDTTMTDIIVDLLKNKYN